MTRHGGRQKWFKRSHSMQASSGRSGDGTAMTSHDLEHERLVRMRRRGDDVDAPRLQFDHKHGVVRDQPMEGPDLGREEIRGDDRAQCARRNVCHDVGR